MCLCLVNVLWLKVLHEWYFVVYDLGKNWISLDLIKRVYYTIIQITWTQCRNRFDPSIAYPSATAYNPEQICKFRWGKTISLFHFLCYRSTHHLLWANDSSTIIEHCLHYWNVIYIIRKILFINFQKYHIFTQIS